MPAAYRPFLDQIRTAFPQPISSPVQGTLIHVDVAVGKVVEPTEHLFEIVLAEVAEKILDPDVPRRVLKRVGREDLEVIAVDVVLGP